MSKATCPRCRGAGFSNALVDRRGRDGELRGSFERLPCPVCKGDREIDADHADRIERGRRHYRARVGREEGLRECATRYGCTRGQLAAYEHQGQPLPDGCRPDEV